MTETPGYWVQGKSLEFSLCGKLPRRICRRSMRRTSNCVMPAACMHTRRCVADLGLNALNYLHAHPIPGLFTAQVRASSKNATEMTQRAYILLLTQSINALSTGMRHDVAPNHRGYGYDRLFFLVCGCVWVVCASIR